LPIIRDTEIEQLMRDYSAPILKAAGLAQQNVQVVLINERAFNAFVMDGRRIFINTGALYDSKTPNEIIGVLSHETGHMAGGHLSRMREQLANAQTASIIALLLGVGAIAAGAATGNSNAAGQAGMAALTAPQEMIRRSLLSYVRAQEESADRAGVKFLNATQQSAKGMYTTFKRFASDMMIISSRIDPISRRIDAERARRGARGPDQDQSLLGQARPAGTAGASRHDARQARRLPRAPGQRDAALSLERHQPARALCSRDRGLSFSGLAVSMPLIDALIQTQPNNPYFHELKGQALLEGTHPADAIAPLRRAVALAPNATLVRIMLGQALVATNEPRYADEAISLLRVAMQRESEMPEVYSQLAMAYGRKGELAEADLASAQAALARGDMKTARELSARAKTRFPTGSPGWVKADDIVGLKQPKTSFFSGGKFTIGPAQPRGPFTTGPTQ